MKNAWFKKPIPASTVVLFWLVILALFAILYFFFPSLLHQMRQATYQETPYVDTPRTF